MLKLTKEDEGYIRDNLRYDPETGELWWTKPLGTRPLDRPAGSKQNQGYFMVDVEAPSRRCRLLNHRLAWFLYYGFWPNDMLDHINGDRRDNRIANLRLASGSQNHGNMAARVGGSSKYKGVSWHKTIKKWKVSLCADRKRKHLGYYTSEEEAARAYDKAARETFGEYARLNFPEEHEQGAVNGLDT